MGIPDTIRFELSVDDVVGNDIKLVGKLFFFNDVQDVAGASVGFGWDNPNLKMDSAKMTAVALNAFEIARFLFKRSNINLTNRDQQFQFSGVLFLRNGLLSSLAVKHVATYWFTLSVAAEDTVCVDTAIVGDPAYAFAAIGSGNYSPIWSGKQCLPFDDNDNDGIIDLIDNCPELFNPDQLDDDNDGIGNVCDSIFNLPCGDANGSGDVTFSDLDFLINYYFMFGDPPVLIEAVDVNGDGTFDLGDIMFLANFLNGIGPISCGGSEPPPSFDPKKEPKGRSTGPTGY